MGPGRVRNIITGVCEVGDGLIAIGTLGRYHARLAFRFLAWAELRHLRGLHRRS